jgi:hypothetical protein
MMMADEVDISVASYLNLKPLLDSGVGIAVLRSSEAGYPPEFAALPSLADVALPGTPPQVIEIMDTLNALGRLVMAVPNTDPAVVDALRTAFDQLVATPSVVELFASQRLDLVPMAGAELEERMATLLGDRAAGDIFRAYLACGEEEAAAGTAIDCSSR